MAIEASGCYRTSVRASVLVMGLVLGSACLAHEPGSVMGTYAVTGTLQTNTCSGLGDAQNPWTFDVRLSKSGETLFWLQDSAPALSGTVDPQGNATLKTSEDLALQSADGGVYCAVVRSDTFTAALGTTEAPASFKGTIAYHYDVDPSSTCPMLALPCDVSYALAAQEQDQ